MSITLHDELLLLNSNNTSMIHAQTSVLDPNTSSETTMTFTILLLAISSCGILTTPLLWYGLYRDLRILLIPWIITIIALIVTDMTHCLYIFFELVLKIHPVSAILVTLNLFVGTLNIYALVCVISQYQEYKAGRGRYEDDLNRVPSVHYTAQPTATSYLSTRRAVTYNETKASPTHSPPGDMDDALGVCVSDTTPSPIHATAPPNLNRGPRKSVKFPDLNEMGIVLISPPLQHRNGSKSGPPGGENGDSPWTIAIKNENGVKETTDKAPLITTPIPIETHH